LHDFTKPSLRHYPSLFACFRIIESSLQEISAFGGSVGDVVIWRNIHSTKAIKEIIWNTRVGAMERFYAFNDENPFVPTRPTKPTEFGSIKVKPNRIISRRERDKLFTDTSIHHRSSSPEDTLINERQDQQQPPQVIVPGSSPFGAGSRGSYAASVNDVSHL
jgi:hypothetical protein